MHSIWKSAGDADLMADQNGTQNRGGHASSSNASASRIPKVFPAAAQPDIVRASQKDELYLHYLTDACQDAVRRLLGPRRALLWNRETAVVAQVLYYGLTTGAGMQTLGEEYCDILQVSGPVGVPPQTVRRGLLVLLETVLPYLADRIGGLAQQDDTHVAPWASQSPFAHSNAASTPSPSSQDSRLLSEHQQWQAAYIDFMQAIWSRRRKLWQFISPYSGIAMRLHLALFYSYGLYYHWSKRATGVRYMFIGKLYEHRPSYHLLGLLLFVQLGITSASWAVQRLTQASGIVGKDAQQMQSAVIHSSREQKAVVLEDHTDRVAGPPPIRLSEGGDVLAHKKCPLCLSLRHHPTATPCGHVFCWQCIAEWGNQKPECPLCRSPFTQSSLVCVQHANF